MDTEGNPIYSRTYSADVLAKLLALYFRTGVYTVNNSTALQVVANTGMTVKVKAGAANINGRQFYEETDRVLSVQAANASLDRIGHGCAAPEPCCEYAEHRLLHLAGHRGCDTCCPELDAQCKRMGIGAYQPVHC